MKINNPVPNYQFLGRNTEGRPYPPQVIQEAASWPLPEAGIASGPSAQTPADRSSNLGVYSKPKARSAAATTGSIPASQADKNDTDNDSAAKVKSSPASNPYDSKLSQQEKLEVAELRKADMEVKAHERAHLAAAGQYARSGADYKYVRGPDGKDYAVAGEVQIDTSAESTPQRTITKMEVVRRAALAPANPSSQDLQVATSATKRILAAYEELTQQKNLESVKQKEKTAAENEKNEAASGSAANREQTTSGQTPANTIGTPSFPLISRPFYKGIDLKV